MELGCWVLELKREQRVEELTGTVSPAAVQQYHTADDVLTGLIIFLGTTFLCR